jgi:hypothetical protein
MPIGLDRLERSATQSRVAKASNLYEAKAQSLTTAFLCHSHKDANLVKGFVNLLIEKGIDLYVDWADTTMPDTPNRDTARRIQQKIRELNLFLFLATPNSVTSRWCPWEIGYADGTKDLSRIVVVPTRDRSGQNYGNEYLQLYRHIDVGVNEIPEIFEAGAAFGRSFKSSL